ncbi:thioredoxin family protein [Elizabethkingia anophelis]|uniref:thioredoxin family protein n=1 Tax=Elizabethkingia anophelis TaxID=1117645 RepID=UPI00099B1C81|nr:thioredoxin family protein [Elizabethkingia anophelis]MDV4129071.1 thioredoxin family protein [Elizabethkingia anophelis]MDV4133863.1 thioredoxin family protein [Elizabethkingia anophelis]OPC66830.1 thioredoxin [Elizabethkingia anophelis]
MDIKKFWDEAVAYNEYLRHAGEILGNPRNQQDVDYLEYYKLGIQRMNRMSEKYLPNEKQVETLAQKNFRGRILIISEAWCGDASQAIPVVVKFFEQYEVRITYRDQEPSLIDDFLTNGGKSIPIILFLDENFNVIGQWGPRPAHGKELLNKHKNDPENYTKDDFYHELQVYYARNKGYDTIEELLEIIPSGK